MTVLVHCTEDTGGVSQGVPHGVKALHPAAGLKDVIVFADRAHGQWLCQRQTQGA